MTNLEIMEINIIREFRNLYVKNMVYIYILRGGVGWKEKMNWNWIELVICSLVLIFMRLVSIDF